MSNLAMVQSNGPILESQILDGGPGGGKPPGRPQTPPG